MGHMDPMSRQGIDDDELTMTAKRARVETSGEEKSLLLQKRIDESFETAREAVRQDVQILGRVRDLLGGLKGKTAASLKRLKADLDDLSAFTIDRVAKAMVPYVCNTGAELVAQQAQVETELKVLNYSVQQMLANNIVKENGTYDFKTLVGMVDSAITYAEGREAMSEMRVD